MLKYLVPFLIFFCFSIKVSSQTSKQKKDHCDRDLTKERGMYVNEFFNFTKEDKVDEAHSILGIDTNKDGKFEKEDSLLNFLKQNHFNQIILYDLSNVLNNKRLIYNGASLVDHLERFIIKAKSEYRIKYIGAAIGSFALPESRKKINKVRNTYTCLVNQDIHQIDLGSDTINKKEEIFDQLKESVKMVKQIFNYNHSAMTGDPVADKIRIIDRVIPEYEFWNYPSGYGGRNDNKFRDFAYKDFKELLKFISCLKANSYYPLYIDVYLGHLGLDNIDDKEQVKFIDKIADRIYLSAYHHDPDTMFTFVKKRLDLFGSPLNGSKPLSEVFIIFSAESLDCVKKEDPYNKHWNEFLGNYLQEDGSLACAEEFFHEDYERFKDKNNWDSKIAGYQWFNYSVLKKNCKKE